MTSVRSGTLIFLFAFLAGGAGFASLGPGAVLAHNAGAKQAAAKKTVPIKEVNGQYVFAKAKITVSVGTRVVWTNNSDAPHTVTSTKSGQFNKSVAAGKTVSIVFKKAGTYSYFCAIHPYMKAKVVVK